MHIGNGFVFINMNVLDLFSFPNRVGTMLNDTSKKHPAGRRGRGSLSNEAGRYEPHRRVGWDDGWGTLDEKPPPLRTSLHKDASRSVIARNQSPDVGFDRSINPYRGCEHGCVYCFARPTHAWLGLSPGLDFESRIFIKPDAPQLLARELSRKNYDCKPIALGTNTDPYQPSEAKLKITRALLQVLEEFQHPVTIVTKSNLVLRDADILARMADRRLAKVAISVTTLDRVLARRMEPRAPTPERRLSAIAGLARLSVPTAVMTAPLVPALNDMELEDILKAAAAHGAGEAGYVLLRLPLEVKALWREWLEEHYPDRAARIMRHVREARGGRDYDSRFHQRQTGNGPYADLLAKRFELACRRLGLNKRKFDLATDAFAVPPKKSGQMSLF
jgi:DNA repair photolyase